MKTKLLIYMFCLFGALMFTGCSTRYVHNVRYDVPVYAEEDTSSTVVGTLQSGSKAEVLYEGWNGWYKVQFQGQEAYISGDNVEYVYEDGEKIWMCKTVLRGLGYMALIIIGIVLALAIIGLVYIFLRFLFGLLMSMITWVVGFAFIAWILGYIITQDIEQTFHFIAGGAILGAIVSIVRMIRNPVGESAQGVKSAQDAYNDYQRAEAKREAEAEKQRAMDYPFEMGDGTRARKQIDGTLIDEVGREYQDNGDGTATRIN